MIARLLLNFNFNVPCQTSPRCCSQGSPAARLELNFFLKKLVDKLKDQRRFKLWKEGRKRMIERKK